MLTQQLPLPLEGGGMKFDQDKLRFDLIPPDALALVAAVLTFGAAKYSDRNWEQGLDRARLVTAIERHVNALKMGEDLDPEHGQPHMASIATNALMWCALYLRGVGTDTTPVLPGNSHARVQDFTKAMQEGIARIRAARAESVAAALTNGGADA